MAEDQAKLSDAVEEHELEDEQERQGGVRLNRRALIVAAGVLMIAAIFVVQGIRSAGVTPQKPEAQHVNDEAGQAARDKAEMEELKARAMRAAATPSVTVPIAPPVSTQVSVQHSPKPPSRYAQWAQDKYMRALEAPEMVSAAHGGGTLEIGRAQSGDTSSPLNASTPERSVR